MTLGENFILSCCCEDKSELFFKTPKEYFDPTEKTKHTFVSAYFLKHSEFPPLDVYNTKFRVKYKYPSGKADYYATELKNRFIYITLSEQIPKIVTKLKKDPIKSLDEFKAVISSVHIADSASKDKVYSANAIDRYKEYEDVKTKGGITYISTGDSEMDKIFRGWNRTDLITAGGPPGLGKTWMLCKNALNCDKTLEDNFGPILVVTNEISKLDMEQRYDAIRFELPWEQFLDGSLSPRREQRYRRGLRSLQKKGSRIITLEYCNRIEELHSKIVMYKPAITFIDGSYLLEPEMEEGFAKSVYVTRSLKQIVGECKSPIFNTTQIRKGRGKKAAATMLDRQDDFYYGSIIQDSDIALRMYQTPEMVYYSKFCLDIAKGRKVKTGNRIYFVNDLENMVMRYELDDENDKEDENASELEY